MATSEDRIYCCVHVLLYFFHPLLVNVAVSNIPAISPRAPNKRVWTRQYCDFFISSFPRCNVTLTRNQTPILTPDPSRRLFPMVTWESRQYCQFSGINSHFPQFSREFQSRESGTMSGDSTISGDSTVHSAFGKTTADPGHMPPKTRHTPYTVPDRREIRRKPLITHSLTRGEGVVVCRGPLSTHARTYTHARAHTHAEISYSLNGLRRTSAHQEKHISYGTSETVYPYI